MQPMVFLFSNFWLLLFILIIWFVADIFGTFKFPLNLPAPIIRAFGSAFCIAFILIVFQWVDNTYGTTVSQFFWLIPSVIVPLVFLIILATGYYVIFRQLSEQPKTESEVESDTILVNGERYDLSRSVDFRCEILGRNRRRIPGDAV